jgi:subfamily B ATP-binding cassette protein MsbA
MKSDPAGAAWVEAQRLIHRECGPLTLALVLMVIGRAAALALPAGSRYLVDQVIGRHREDELWVVGILIGAGIVLEASTGYGAMQLAGVAGQRASAGVRQELQARIIGLPLPRLETSSVETLVARVMTDSEQIRFVVGNGLVQLLASTLTATLALALLFSLNGPLTFAVLGVVILLGRLVHRSFGRIWAALESVLRRQSDLSGAFGQVLVGVRVVKAYAAEREEAYRFARGSHELVRESLHVLRGVSFLNASLTMASGALGLLLLIIGGRAVATGGMSLGDLVMYGWLLGLLLGPVTHLAGNAGELGKGMAALGRIAQLRALATEAEEDRTCAVVRRIAGAVDFDDVTYRYSDERLGLRGVSLHVPACSMIGVVGANGSGKSTLCRLLLAFDRPISGCIRIDGRDLATLDRRRYRARLGVVSQDELLFQGTIEDNIRYGRPKASLAQLRAAARLAHCEEFVAGLPEGYATLIGAPGLGLSAGERQRVAIARAFLADPQILVLDEATSSLDVESERLVQDALQLLCQGRTTFIVTHRLATLRRADQIVVLDRGSVVERGTHEELIASGGRYFGLWEAGSRDGSRSRPVGSRQAGPFSTTPGEGGVGLLGGNGRAP